MRRVLATTAVALLAMGAAACSRPKSETSLLDTTSNTTLPDNLGPVIGATDTTLPGGVVAGPTAGGDIDPATGQPRTAGGPNVVNPDGTLRSTNFDEEQARRIGAQITPQSTARRKPYAIGVGEDTIQLNFSYDRQSCGVNVVSALTAAGGALPTSTQFYRPAPNNTDAVRADAEETVQVMVDYFNANAFRTAEYTPKIRSLMGNDPKNQFFGRHLTYKMIDGGSNQCPEKTTAAAKQAAQTNKAFAVINNYDGAMYNMAAALNLEPADRRPMHFGSLWLSDQIYTKFAPFSWTQFATGTTIARQLASYICGRVAPGQVPARSTLVKNPAQRVFGLVHTNLAEDKVLISEFKGFLKQFCGRDIIGSREVEYEGKDFSKAQADNQNVITQLRAQGVTTAIMLTDPVQPLFQLTTASGQGYNPEWIWSSFGFTDSNTVQRLYKSAGTETAGSFGTTNLGVYGGFGFGAGDPFNAYHATHKTAPDGKPCDPRSPEGMGNGRGAAVEKYCKAPTALATFYYALLPLIGGLVFAGPDVTAVNVSKGLQNFPVTRFGGSGPTTDPRPALVGPGAGRYGFIADATEWRWRRDFSTPPPESKAEGWVEYPDCMRHYLLWPDGLAPFWEKNGSNYNAWCGDQNGYPKVTEKDIKPYG